MWQSRWRPSLISATLAVCTCALVLLATSGCQTPQKTYAVDRPARHSVATKHFVVQSNFRIAADSSLVRDLNQVREQVSATLQLPEQRDPVTVYLFDNEASYRRYMQTTWPNLPPRRAYFVGTTRELAVYSFQSPRVREDLRHEFTHGLLHASLNTVPLWLDEGLAEYFEVAGEGVGTPHREHVEYLQNARAGGWNPSLYQLETLSDFRRMTQRDYAESWGWVHYMLDGNPSARQLLIDYVASLRDTSAPGQLMPMLEQTIPTYHGEMQAHVSRISENVTVANHEM